MIRNALRSHSRCMSGARIGTTRIAILWLVAISSVSAQPSPQQSDNHPVIPGFLINKKDVTKDETQLRGQLVINELNCAACHAVSHAAVKPKQAPDLAGITQRVAVPWLRSFIAAPQQIKPGTTMPAMFKGSFGKDKMRVSDQIDALVHFLGSTRLAKPLAKLPRRSTVSRGKLLYHRYGCVACHGPDPVPQKPDNPVPIGVKNSYVPFPNLKEKYSQRTLTDFLLDPLRYRAAGRMPAMKLDLQDASDIAAYLVRKTGSMDNKEANQLPRFKHDKARAERGRQLFSSLGCANCHALPDMRIAAKAVKIDSLKSPTDDLCAGRPNFGMSAAQQDVVRQILTGDANKEQHVSAASKTVELTLRTFNCYQCHKRQGRGPDEQKQAIFTGDSDLADEGRLPPDLTNVGRKLTAAWLTKLFEGKGDVRPYLHTRMPNFASRNLAHLPKALIEADQGGKHKADRYFADGDIEIGRELMGTKGGLGCIMCHNWKDRKSLGIPGMNLATTTQRLQPAWFKQNMLDPGQLRPRTLMPTFWPKGIGVNKRHFNGDADKQIASLWRYLDAGKKQPPGYPEFSKGQYEIQLTTATKVMRTFTVEGGTHSIVVGHPHGVHYIYDTLKSRLAHAWRGRFIDAYSTWFDRFVAPAKALGHDQVTLGKSSLITSTEKDIRGYRYRGYRLDRQRIPTFLYAFTNATVTDRIEPLKSGDSKAYGLRRTLTIETKRTDLRLNVNQTKGLRIKIVQPKSFQSGPGPRPIPPGRNVIVLEYQW